MGKENGKGERQRYREAETDSKRQTLRDREVGEEQVAGWPFKGRGLRMGTEISQPARAPTVYWACAQG